MTADVDATISDGQPPAEHEIDEALVRRLLEDQHPDLADRDLRYVADGWDNITFRLGDDLAVRLPRREVAAELFESEQRWLPVLARRVDVAVPEPVRSGRPGAGYPWPWSVVRWIAGTPVDEDPLDPGEAAPFGRFLSDLHGPAPDAAPRNPYRGIPLQAKTDALGIRWDRLADLDIGLTVEVDAVRAAWAAVVDTAVDLPMGWTHSDLHPKNLVGDGGRLAGVIDWGDLGVADPALDLAAAWMLFPPAVHADLWAAYGGISDATHLRARGWAIFFGTVLLDTAGDGDDTFDQIGRDTLERVVIGEG